MTDHEWHEYFASGLDELSFYDSSIREIRVRIPLWLRLRRVGISGFILASIGTEIRGGGTIGVWLGAHYNTVAGP